MARCRCISSSITALSRYAAAGSIRVEIQDRTGNPLAGYELDACDEIYGDELNRVVLWDGKADLQKLAGEPIRLRMVLRDADLFSLRFRRAERDTQ